VTSEIVFLSFGLFCFVVGIFVIGLLLGLWQRPAEPLQMYRRLTVIKRGNGVHARVPVYVYTVSPDDLPAVDREAWEEARRALEQG
jgi:hypothetical protein